MYGACLGIITRGWEGDCPPAGARLKSANMKKAAVFFLGLVLGVLVLAAGLNSGGTFWGVRETRGIVREQLVRASKSPSLVLTAADLKGLPAVARKYLVNSGVLGKPLPRSVRLCMKGSMSLGPGKAWVPFDAEQYFSVDQPSLVWFGVVKVAPLLSISARDSYIAGEGRMYVRLMSLLKLDDARGKDMDLAALTRYLSEMMWFPAAFAGRNIKWKGVDGKSAWVSITDNGIWASGLCRFDGSGNINEFSAPRLCSITGKMEEWKAGPGDGAGGAVKYMEVNGVRIPANACASFRLRGGDYPYIKLELTRVEYDPVETY